MVQVPKFVYNNIPIKKIAYGNQKGSIKIMLYDGHYSKIFQGEARINNKKEVKELFSNLKAKGFNFFNETSWF